MKMKQAGFTLIELVVVITILGILAAFALPRFANVESQARIASINGLAGGMRAAVALAHSQWLVDGATAGSVTIQMEGVNVDLVDGWPDASTTGIDAAMQDLSSYGGSAGNYTLRANCLTTYALGVGGAAPTINTDTSGC